MNKWFFKLIKHQRFVIYTRARKQSLCFFSTWDGCSSFDMWRMFILHRSVYLKIINMFGRVFLTFCCCRKWSYWPLQPGKQHVSLSRVSFPSQPLSRETNIVHAYSIFLITIDAFNHAVLDWGLYFLGLGSSLMACYRLQLNGISHISFLN